MSLKRKHVTFDESAGPEPAVPAAAAVHPDRARQVDGAAPAAKKPKVKSEKKKRYLAKKARRQRALRSARKKAMKKGSSGWSGSVGEGGEGSGSDESDDSDEESDDEEEEEEEKDNEEEAKDNKDAAPAPAPTKSLSLEEQARLERKAEKRAKRDARRAERRAKREAERKAAAERAAKAAAKAATGEAMEDDEETEDKEEKEADEPEAMDGDEVEAEAEPKDDAEDAEIPDLPTRMRTPSPPPLEPFPLPRMAPAPSDAVLSRQGLPAGLADATFIDQGDRLAVADLAASLGAGSAGLSERTQKRLAELGVTDLFAVQAAMLPHLLRLPLVPLPHAKLDDFLVSAPTGSGKTLAYAIPIVEVLARRVVPRLRALIVLPTRDLVVQVKETLEALAKGTGLLIGSVTGQHSFAQEQAMLVDDSESLLGGSSKLDILIATPGRLMDHLASTPNFTLQHLRFLVIDEADRLLTQSFQNWLAQVLAHARPPTAKTGKTQVPHDAVAAAWSEPLGLASGEFEGSEEVRSTCQKLLFSATLTRDPAKVAALDLASPRYFIVQSSSNPLTAAAVGSSFALPEELVEKVLILPPALKPLNLIHLLHGFDASPALVFTKSVEAASRLVKLLSFFEDAYIGGKRLTVRGYTRDMPVPERKKLLADFAAGNIDVIVASDLVARGIDLPTVAHVISYDVPLDMTKYVHRAGRTARAGRSGTAWTLVEKQEAIHFKNMMRGAGREKGAKKVKVKEDDLAGYKESYALAMGRLKEVYGRD